MHVITFVYLIDKKTKNFVLTLRRFKSGTQILVIRCYCSMLLYCRLRLFHYPLFLLCFFPIARASIFEMKIKWFTH